MPHPLEVEYLVGVGRPPFTPGVPPVGWDVPSCGIGVPWVGLFLRGLRCQCDLDLCVRDDRLCPRQKLCRCGSILGILGALCQQ